LSLFYESQCCWQKARNLFFSFFSVTGHPSYVYWILNGNFLNYVVLPLGWGRENKVGNTFPKTEIFCFTWGETEFCICSPFVPGPLKKILSHFCFNEVALKLCNSWPHLHSVSHLQSRKHLSRVQRGLSSSSLQKCGILHFLQEEKSRMCVCFFFHGWSYRSSGHIISREGSFERKLKVLVPFLSDQKIGRKIGPLPRLFVSQSYPINILRQPFCSAYFKI
jgi:hypothetical protein